MRIERGLDPAHQGHGSRTQLPLDVRDLGGADAVLAGQRTTHAQDRLEQLARRGIGTGSLPIDARIDEEGGMDVAVTEMAEVDDGKLVLDPEVIVARMHGRQGWVREACHQLDEHRRLAGDPIPRSRSERLLECERRLQENLRVEREANEAYEHHRATAVTKDGRRFGARPNPYVAPEVPPGKINVTDLDSRNVKTPRSYTQGYNVQAAVNEHQIVLAAEVTLSSPDFGQLEPMVKATRRELVQIDVSEAPGSPLRTAATGMSSRWTAS